MSDQIWTALSENLIAIFSVDGPAALSYKLEYKNIYNTGSGVLWDFIFLLSHSCWFFSHQFI